MGLAPTVPRLALLLLGGWAGISAACAAESLPRAASEPTTTAPPNAPSSSPPSERPDTRSTQPDTPPATPSATGGPARVAAETDYQRELRLAKGKRDQCLRLGMAIEVVQPKDAMVVEGNGAELARVADELEQAARELEEVPVEATRIASLRRELTGNWRDMAGALAAAGTAASEGDGKAALARFRDHESRVQPLLGALSEACNAPNR